MSLDYNLSDIKNYNSLYRKLKKGEEGYSETEVYKKLKPQFERIIWVTMIIGIREITDKNWERFYNRINIWEKVFGSGYYKRNRKKLVPILVTKEDVQRMIGLSTNASPLSDTKFKKYFFENMKHNGIGI